MLGIGENGHIAFNDPPFADFGDPKLVKVVELAPACRGQQVHGGCFDALDEVPRRALTVTIPGIMRVGHLFCSVPGRTKAEAVKHCLEGVASACPASILQTHPSALLYTDADAGSSLLP